MTRRLLLSAGCAALAETAFAAPPAPIRAGEAVDYAPLAFYPDAWRKNSFSFTMYPWQGKSVVLLTTRNDFDGGVMARFLERLDGGWQLYTNIIGTVPKPLRQVAGKPIITAVPDFTVLDGAYARGFVGLTGIEAGGFYRYDYPMVRANPNAFPHYYFYEMGRNFFLFGNRHSCFTTGFAVFMRYVCMESLKCYDPEDGVRRVIESAEGLYAQSHMGFLRAFTNAAGMGEKDTRIHGSDGTPLVPSDQPVMYASAQLKLWREYGRNDWARRFFAALRVLPESPDDTEAGALSQSLNWFVAASVAARRSLVPLFVDRWRLPLTAQQRKIAGETDWKTAPENAQQIVRRLIS